MKITVLPTGNAPTHYSFEGEVVTAHSGGFTEVFDLSVVTTGGEFTGVTVDTLDVPATQVVRDAYRDSAGDLHVTLCQRVGPGHWEAGSEFDAVNYQPDKAHVTYRTDKAHAGTPWAITSLGKRELA
jgi:hypothetical protein